LPVNDPPVLIKFADSVLEDESLSKSKLLLLSKVNDVDDDHFIFKTIKQAGYGKWLLNEDGDFTYMPSKDYYGTDSVMIEVKDIGGLADTAWISLNVLPVNDPPVSLVDTIFYQIFQDESFDLDRNIDAKLVKDVDNTLNQLSIVLVDQPKLGNVISSQMPRLSYNAPVLKTGLDRFYVAFSDGIGQSKIIPFIIRVLSKKRNPLDPAVRVYPNPSRDFVQINNIHTDKWEIRSTDGRLVMQSEIHHNLNHFSINLNSLPKGSYLLYLYKEKRVIVIKRIVLN
jgi:VCBS repeat-containing protein